MKGVVVLLRRTGDLALRRRRVVPSFGAFLGRPPLRRRLRLLAVFLGRRAPLGRLGRLLLGAARLFLTRGSALALPGGALLLVLARGRRRRAGRRRAHGPPGLLGLFLKRRRALLHVVVRLVAAGRVVEHGEVAVVEEVVLDDAVEVHLEGGVVRREGPLGPHLSGRRVFYERPLLRDDAVPRDTLLGDDGPDGAAGRRVLPVVMMIVLVVVLVFLVVIIIIVGEGVAGVEVDGARDLREARPVLRVPRRRELQEVVAVAADGRRGNGGGGGDRFELVRVDRRTRERPPPRREQKAERPRRRVWRRRALLLREERRHALGVAGVAKVVEGRVQLRVAAQNQAVLDRVLLRVVDRPPRLQVQHRLQPPLPVLSVVADRRRRRRFLLTPGTLLRRRRHRLFGAVAVVSVVPFVAVIARERSRGEGRARRPHAAELHVLEARAQLGVVAAAPRVRRVLPLQRAGARASHAAALRRVVVARPWLGRRVTQKLQHRSVHVAPPRHRLQLRQLLDRPRQRHLPPRRVVLFLFLEPSRHPPDLLFPDDHQHASSL
mmetsp:Transcript_17322/g.52710  ORF Transcript_17322/g.52710 Transcript_17322/m.52710 type:complete len:548 (+) Transcript_17322:1161-2804(+)